MIASGAKQRICISSMGFNRHQASRAAVRARPVGRTRLCIQLLAAPPSYICHRPRGTWCLVSAAHAPRSKSRSEMRRLLARASYRSCLDPGSALVALQKPLTMAGRRRVGRAIAAAEYVGSRGEKVSRRRPSLQTFERQRVRKNMLPNSHEMPRAGPCR